MNEIDWCSRAEAMADSLAAIGVLNRDWYAAFAATPRHLFVPYFYQNGTFVDSTDPVHRDQWLDTVYADTSLITQQAIAPGTDLAWPTSSSTMPSLMARMLTLLDVRPGQNVLEIGTGTGYHAALLCHRLSDANVTSVDIDPELVERARARLSELGYQPHLAAGNGAAGVAAHAPYDRIIATCAIQAVPPAWITQLAPDGIIVTDLRGEVSGSLLVARKTSADTVQGRFQSTPDHFMWLRAQADNPLRDGGTYPLNQTSHQPHTTTTTITPGQFDDQGLRFVLQLRIPDLKYAWKTTEDDAEVIGIATISGDRVQINTTPDQHGRYPVTHTGALWRGIEHVVNTWNQLGRPTRDRFGLTATASGHQHVWLDQPGTIKTSN